MSADISSSPRQSSAASTRVEQSRHALDKSSLQRPCPSSLEKNSDRSRTSTSSLVYSEDSIQRSSSRRGSKNKILIHQSSLRPTSDPFSDDPFFSSSTPTNKQSVPDVSHDRFAAFNELSNVTTSSTFNTSPAGGTVSSNTDLFTDTETSVFTSIVNNTDSQDANQGFVTPVDDSFSAFNKSLCSDTPRGSPDFLERVTRRSGTSNKAWTDNSAVVSARNSPQLTRANSQPQAQSAWTTNG